MYNVQALKSSQKNVHRKNLLETSRKTARMKRFSLASYADTPQLKLPMTNVKILMFQTFCDLSPNFNFFFFLLLIFQLEDILQHLISLENIEEDG